MYTHSKLVSKLKRKDEGVNNDKTEKHRITKKGFQNWKKSKYLGSLMGTENYIKRRKSLTIQACKS